jgi:hypothetical protein
MVPGGGRATAQPVAAKVGADYRKGAGEQRRDAAPHQVRLREAVQQEDRRPGPLRAHENAGLTRLDLGRCELIHPDTNQSIDILRRHNRILPFSLACITIVGIEHQSSNLAM